MFYIIENDKIKLDLKICMIMIRHLNFFSIVGKINSNFMAQYFRKQNLKRLRVPSGTEKRYIRHKELNSIQRNPDF